MDDIKLTAKVRMNDLEEPFDGGRLLLHCDDGETRKAGWSQAEIILNAPTDAKLAEFPSTRVEKERRVFEITIRDVTPTA